MFSCLSVFCFVSFWRKMFRFVWRGSSYIWDNLSSQVPHRSFQLKLRRKIIPCIANHKKQECHSKCLTSCCHLYVWNFSYPWDLSLRKFMNKSISHLSLLVNFYKYFLTHCSRAGLMSFEIFAVSCEDVIYDFIGKLQITWEW